jgi:hypothetical protein
METLRSVWHECLLQKGDSLTIPLGMIDTKWFLSTRLETRTKESNKYASSRVANLFRCEVKAKTGWISGSVNEKGCTIKKCFEAEKRWKHFRSRSFSFYLFLSVLVFFFFFSSPFNKEKRRRRRGEKRGVRGGGGKKRLALSLRTQQHTRQTPKMYCYIVCVCKRHHQIAGNP